MHARPPRRPALPLALAAIIGVAIGPALGAWLGVGAATTGLGAVGLAATGACGVAFARRRWRRRAAERTWVEEVRALLLPIGRRSPGGPARGHGRGPAGRVVTALVIVAVVGASGAWAARVADARARLDPRASCGLGPGPQVVRGALVAGPWTTLGGRIRFVLETGGVRALVDAPGSSLQGAWPLPGARVRLVACASPPRAGGREVAALQRDGIALRLEAATIEVEAPGRAATAILGAAARDAGARIDAAVGAERAPLFRALLLGERSRLDPALNAAFRATGTVHILSISGLHVTLLALMAGGAAHALGLGRLERSVAVGLAIVVYVTIAGAAVPTLRAAAAGLVAHALLGRGDAWNRLAVACLVVLAWDPLAPREVGALLSFGTVAALLVLDPLLRAWLDPRRRSAAVVLGGPAAAATRWGRRTVASALAAFLASAPLVGLLLGDLPLSGLVVNPPVVALCGLALGLAAAGLVVGALVPPLGHVLLSLADLPAAALVRVVEAGAAIPGTRWLVPVPSAAATALAVGLLALAAARGSVRGARDRGVRALVATGALLVVALVAPRPALPEPADRPPALRLLAPVSGSIVLVAGGDAVGLGRAPTLGRDRRTEALLGRVPVWLARAAAGGRPGPSRARRSPDPATVVPRAGDGPARPRIGAGPIRPLAPLTLAHLRVEPLAGGSLARVVATGDDERPRGPRALVLLADPPDLVASLASLRDDQLEADALIALAPARAGTLRALVARARPGLVVTDRPPRGLTALPLTGLDLLLTAAPRTGGHMDED